MFPTRLIVAVTAAVMMAGASQASSISFGVTPPGPAIAVPLSTTNFTTLFSVPLFDTTLGTLQDVQFSLNGTVVSQIAFESRDAAPSTITGTAQATITLTRPNNTTLVTVIPTQTRSAPETAFDGAIDFAGTSGNTFADVTGSNSATSGVLTSAADLALFSSAGGGNIMLPVSAAGQSSVSGAGNIISQITTQAGANLTVTYDFAAPTPPSTSVPEPASLALLGVGLLGLGVVRGRK